MAEFDDPGSENDASLMVIAVVSNNKATKF